MAGREVQMIEIGSSKNGNGMKTIEEFGLVLISAMAWRNADANHLGMHSNAKRWNEAVKARPK